MEFLYLADAANAISAFAEKFNSAHILHSEPTLSPKDPKFAEWYKGYEAKMKKAEGPTPEEK